MLKYLSWNPVIIYRFFHRYLFLIVLLALSVYAFGYNSGKMGSPAEASTLNSFQYGFDIDGRLYEASAVGGSSSPYWWLRSGSYLDLTNGIGRTIQGALPANDN